MSKHLQIGEEAMQDLGRAMLCHGWTEETARNACSGQFLSDARLVLMDRARVVPHQRRHIVVDYSMSWEAMLAAGEYGWVAKDISAKNFPIKGAGRLEFETEEFWYNWNLTSRRAIELIEMDDLDNPWKPARVEHGFAYGAQHPEQQSKYPIICLGSTAMVAKRKFVIRLYRGGGDRFLFLYANDWDGGWTPLNRFLAIRPVCPATIK